MDHSKLCSAAANLDVRPMKRSRFVTMTLRSFIGRWSEELCDYYGEDFGCDAWDVSLISDTNFGDTMVFVIVDNGSGLGFGIDTPVEEYDPIPDDVKKKIRKSGKWRRNKLKHKWSYNNPLNRIHGYLILSDVTNKSHPKKTYAIDAVCSSFYTKAKGIGSDLIDLAKMFSNEMNAHDLVLEVANEYSGMGIESETEEEESDEEDSGEELEEEILWYPDESTLDVISEEFWKKCMRRDKRGNPVYNLDKEYLSELLSKYFMAETSHEYNGLELWEGTEKRVIREKDDPGEDEYGGFWYRKGKKSQNRLMKFYEMHGFKEDSNIHTDWCCFSEVPYPTMRFTLN